MSTDQWSRAQYRRQVAWPERIVRERPLLERVLAAAPARRVLDLGCGSGEHCRYLAAQGFDVIGIDSSAAMIELASEGAALPDNLRFINADIADVGAIGLPPVGAALCLGNTLPHLGDEDLRRFAHGIADALLPGGTLLLQLLNYERIRTKRVRYLPLNFRASDDGDELVFLRLVDMKADGTVKFMPTTLRLRPDRDPPVELIRSRRVCLHGWTWVELCDVFSAAGFGRAGLFGGFDGEAFAPTESFDLIAVLRRGSDAAC